MRWLRPDRLILLVMGVLVLAGALTIGGRMWLNSQEVRDRAVALTGGDPDHGKALLRRYGCIGCHDIPGVRGAEGQVGPSLKGFAGRQYIGGAVENSAANLIQWLEDPRSLAPHTAMPKTGLDTQQARDVAALLYTLK
jgi:cytochrome c2